MSQPLQHIIFDLDGTLIDSAPDLVAAINAMLQELQLPSTTPEQVKLWIGNGATKLVERALAHTPATTHNSSLEVALDIFYRHYQRLLGQFSTLYPGVEQGLQQLYEAGLTLSLCTNKPNQFTLPLLEQFALTPYFQHLVCGDSLKHKKPHPEPLLWLCRESGIAVKNTLMVGDSMNDVQAAKAANMAVVCVSYGYSQGLELNTQCHGQLYHDFASLVNSICQTSINGE
jgi:phosphoglycolate phosphatase